MGKKTCFLKKIEQQQQQQKKRFLSTLETTGIKNLELYKLHIQLQMCHNNNHHNNNNVVMIIDFT